MKAIITGTFDPVTVGHEALIERASRIFDEVVVLMCQNFDKTTLFSPEERLELLRLTADRFSNVRVERHDGWLYEYLKTTEDAVVFKGVRNSTDLEYEKKMAEFNFEHSGVETLFAVSPEGLENVSSTLVRSMMKSGEEWEKLIPQNAQKIAKKFYKNI